MGKKKGIQETAMQKAQADVGRQMIADFQKRWAPLIQKNAQGIVAAGEPGSFERRRAETMAKVDTNAAFTKARGQMDQTAAAQGALGGSAHKLGIAGIGNDQSTSSGLAAVATDQAADDALIGGLGAITALGRGERAQAVNGMANVARMSGRQAEADASASLQSRMGGAQLLGSAAGLGAGLYLNRKQPQPTFFEQGLMPDELENESARLKAWGRP